MPDIAAIIKQEIRRLARKEIRTETEQIQNECVGFCGSYK